MLQVNHQLIPGKKAFFASDFHLGLALHDEPSEAEREKRIIRWLDTIEAEASAIFLLGDIFDFWHEYRFVVPKGNIRLLGKLAAMSDSGISIYIFPGNHDMWMKDYFVKEFGAIVYHNTVEWLINNKKLMLGHGDGLGPGDAFYKLLKHGVFKNPIARFMYKWLHPDIGISLAKTWSANTRAHKLGTSESFLENNEYLVQYCKKMEENDHFDYYVFGHRHLPIDYAINDISRYINLGEWISQYNYGIFDGKDFTLEKFD